MVYFDADSVEESPSVEWLEVLFRLLPEKYHLNLHRIYIVKPLLSHRLRLASLIFTGGGDFFEKVKFIDSLNELYEHISQRQLTVPPGALCLFQEGFEEVVRNAKAAEVHVVQEENGVMNSGMMKVEIDESKSNDREEEVVSEEASINRLDSILSPLHYQASPSNGLATARARGAAASEGVCPTMSPVRRVPAGGVVVGETVTGVKIGVVGKRNIFGVELERLYSPRRKVPIVVMDTIMHVDEALMYLGSGVRLYGLFTTHSDHAVLRDVASLSELYDWAHHEGETVDLVTHGCDAVTASMLLLSYLRAIPGGAILPGDLVPCLLGVLSIPNTDPNPDPSLDPNPDSNPCLLGVLSIDDKDVRLSCIKPLLLSLHKAIHVFNSIFRHNSPLIILSLHKARLALLEEILSFLDRIRVKEEVDKGLGFQMPNPIPITLILTLLTLTLIGGGR